MEGESVMLPVAVSVTPTDVVAYQATNLPYGLGIDTMTGIISGVVAMNAAVGSPYAVSITASNGTATTTAAFTWTVIAPGTVSGRVVVPPNHHVEVEPNQSIDQVQTVVAPAILTGEAAVHDTGFLIPGSGGQKVEDLYKLTTAVPVRITLTMAAKDLQSNDLDLLLMDEAGNVLMVSEGSLATEVIDTPAAGTFLIGVRALQGASVYTLSIETPDSFADTPSVSIPAGAVFVPGEILVKLKPDAAGIRRGASDLAITYGLSASSATLPAATLLRIASPPASSKPGKLSPILGIPGQEDTALKAQTLDTIRALRTDPTVAYAEPNFLRQPAAVPNDEFFGLQWHHAAIQLPQAWEFTIGSANVIVAVLDTGVVTDHPDLQSRLVAGYDFISDPIRANDGDGIDPDPNDTGDHPDRRVSSFHGTHVAGILGAATNNRIGVAGVTWQTRIMPLRVSGVGGASDADLAQAIRYAAGLSNASGTLPAEPADIINISLAAPGFSHTLHNAIRDAIAEGVIVVAAAGNQNTSSLFYPASHAGVISVAAVDRVLQKAAYSNFGSTIDVAAPGGNIDVDRDGDGFVDGILSTSGNDAGRFLYEFFAGTSMASPQVAGVLALMLAVNPHLTLADIEQLLAGTHPDTRMQITRDLGPPGYDEIFGHGLIDASQAVLAAQSIPGGDATTPSEAVLAVSATSLHFESYRSALPIEMTNTGSGTLQITHITADVPWITITPASGTVPVTAYAIVDRADLATGVYAATLYITADTSEGDHTMAIAVTMEVGEDTMGDIGPTFVLVLDAETSHTVAHVQTDASQDYAFTTPILPPGTYRIVAGTDRDDDGVICETGDACGISLAPVVIASGQPMTGLRLVVDSFATPQSASPAIEELRLPTFSRLD
jgi:serine protease